MDLNARAVLSAGLQRAHVLFPGGGSGHQPLSLRPRSPPAMPGFIAGTLQLSNIRNLLRRHVMELACHRRQPDVGSVVSFPKASATLSTSTPDAEEKRATLWLMDAI